MSISEIPSAALADSTRSLAESAGRRSGNDPTATTVGLGCLLPDAFGLRAVRSEDKGRDAIVLARSTEQPGYVEVYTAGAVEVWAADAPVTLLSTRLNPAGLAAVVTRFGAAVAQQIAALKGLSEAQTAARQAEERRDRVLEEIRDYVIRAHESGDVSREYLDEFLEEFGLPSYSERVRVRYEITGDYIVEDRGAAFAKTDARGYLRPDLSELDDVLPDSDTYEIDVNVEALDG